MHPQVFAVLFVSGMKSSGLSALVCAFKSWFFFIKSQDSNKKSLIGIINLWTESPGRQEQYLSIIA